MEDLRAGIAMTMAAARRAPFLRWPAPGWAVGKGDLPGGFLGGGSGIVAAASVGETALSARPAAFVDAGDRRPGPCGRRGDDGCCSRVGGAVCSPEPEGQICFPLASLPPRRSAMSASCWCLMAGERVWRVGAGRNPRSLTIVAATPLGRRDLERRH
ncbi:hypothetical protein QYE76_018703 [Lolium multiflorum]|uniref:Uncharacterized protein n=1 Tax=Lolium multiflorum TaxID=4521 RepID=A0AAD8QEI6_LOLMU|nr:hypothetical protein QYE76_018703 [Lolium multiflorum]